MADVPLLTNYRCTSCYCMEVQMQWPNMEKQLNEIIA